MPFTQHTEQNIVFHTADGFTAAGGLVHGFATRLGGVSIGDCAQLNLGLSRQDDPTCVRENYNRFCTVMDTSTDHLVLTKQVHSDTVRVASRKDILSDLFSPIPYEADGLVTDDPTLTLVCYYADCIPIFLYDPRRRAIAAIHSGWRGTALGIVERAAEMMVSQYGCRPEDILAAIGPGIGSCCFETHADVPDAMTAALGDSARPYIRPLSGGKFSVDLKGINALRLRRSGLLPEHIETLNICTSCRPDLYWSHRRLGDRRGNQAAMIRLAAANCR